MEVINVRTSNRNLIDTILSELALFAEDELVLITSDDFLIQKEREEIFELYKETCADIVFGASADFPFDATGFNYYYWKYYPRQESSYHYIYSNMLLGTAKKHTLLFQELIKLYGKDLLQKTLTKKTYIVDSFHRYYVDQISEMIKSSVKVFLDIEHKIFGVTEGRRSVVRWPIFSARHGFIFNKYEKERLRSNDFGDKQWDLIRKQGKMYNTRVKQIPAIMSTSIIKAAKLGQLAGSVLAYLHSLVSMSKIFIYNKGFKKDYSIFRFSHNRSTEINRTIETLIGHLENEQAFSFSHFNDGEMTFIKKYEQQDHKEVWFGRIQQKYSKQLGELLKAAFLKKQDYYYIGIPCESCHPKLSDYAKKVRQVDRHTIPAMTFHHSLSRYPRILGLIRKKKVYFVVNIHQDLTFFKKIGFKFEESQVIRVPFRNAHKEYNTLKEYMFEEGAIVLLMSGMLAKLLCAHWFERFPKTTFIAFGSSFDDYIQNKINFKLYPKSFPFAKTLIGSRFYLFGYKPHCDNCYDLSN